MKPDTEDEYIPLFSRPVGDRTAGDKALGLLAAHGLVGAILAALIGLWRRRRPPSA